MGWKIKKLLFINNIAEELIIKENLLKREAIEKAKDMISKGTINIDNGQVYNKLIEEVFIDF